MSLVVTAIPYLLSLIMLGGGVANAVGPRGILESYTRWGYPSGFHFVTAILELVAAALILYPPLRPYGMGLALLVLLAALATLMRAGEYSHSPAAILFIMLIAVWWFAGRQALP
jgi:hypothetical protein